MNIWQIIGAILILLGVLGLIGLIGTGLVVEIVLIAVGLVLAFAVGRGTRV